jgi:hypothetical protein
MEGSSERTQPRRNSDVHELSWKVARVATLYWKQRSPVFCKVCHWDDAEDSASTGHSSSQSVSVLD